MMRRLRRHIGVSVQRQDRASWDWGAASENTGIKKKKNPTHFAALVKLEPELSSLTQALDFHSVGFYSHEAELR